MRKLKNAVAITSIIAIVAVVTALVAINPMDNAQAQTSNGICGRDATVQTAIMASIADVSRCADVTNQHLAAITGTLDLSDNSLTELAATDLEGLSGITALDLSDNDIDTLPSHVFDGLTALQEIDLSGNGMSMLPPDPFHKNPNLEVMDASDNDITWLQEGVFINNGALLEVDLSDNDINYLSGTEFTSSPLLTKIDLANNALPGLSMDMFKGLYGLEELYLAGNTGAPFSIDVQALDLGANAFEVGIGGGAPPFTMSATVSATGGTLSHSTVTFPGGGRGMSKVITVTHSGDGPATVTVSDAAFTEGTYSGITAANGTNLSVSQNGAARGICSRTRQIQDAILDLLGGVPCGTVSATDLAGITKPLAVVGTSMSTLREGDLANLTGVRDLYLYGNEINELPAGFFKDAGSFDRVLIQDNPGAPFQLAVTLTERPSGSYVVQMRESTPFRVDVALKATGATLYPRMTDIYGGEITKHREHSHGRRQRRNREGRDRPGVVPRLGTHQLLVLRRVRTRHRLGDGQRAGDRCRHRGSNGSGRDANTRTASARTDRSASRSCRAKRTNQPHSHHVGRVDHHKLDRTGRRRRNRLPDTAPPSY